MRFLGYSSLANSNTAVFLLLPAPCHFFPKATGPVARGIIEPGP